MTIDQQWGDMMDETEFGGFTLYTYSTFSRTYFVILVFMRLVFLDSSNLHVYICT